MAASSWARFTGFMHGGRGLRARWWWLLPVGMVALTVLTVGVFVFRARPPGGYRGPWASQADPGPVLLIPGYGGHRAALETLAGRLRAAGRTATVVTLPGHGTGDLTADASALNGDISATLRAGYPSVDLIGYSAGGVVVRLWLNRYHRFGVVRRVVTLGSPLHGTSVAALAAVFLAGPDCPIACRQLAPFSDLIRGLNKNPIPTQLPWVSIWSLNDTTVIPPVSARLPGAVNVEAQQVCPTEVVAHSRLPTDALVAGMVITSLDGSAWTAAPTLAACGTLRAVGAPQHSGSTATDRAVAPASGE